MSEFTDHRRDSSASPSAVVTNYHAATSSTAAASPSTAAGGPSPCAPARSVRKPMRVRHMREMTKVVIAAWLGHAIEVWWYGQSPGTQSGYSSMSAVLS
jgi:hypothetical protein